MEYIEIKCHYPENFSGTEILPALLGEIGFESFMETEEGISAYIPSESKKNNRDATAHADTSGGL
jgi:ribosomal protein L11 methyltransferase